MQNKFKLINNTHAYLVYAWGDTTKLYTPL